MEIVTIIAGKLFAFRYDDAEENELTRLLDLWTDINYLTDFAKQNHLPNIPGFVKQILKDAELLDDIITKLKSGKLTLGEFFKALDDFEYQNKDLSRQKGKVYKLRVYAIRIEQEFFVITGGGIKMSQRAQDHNDTEQALRKLNKAKSYLKDIGIFDAESFYTLLDENTQ